MTQEAAPHRSRAVDLDEYDRDYIQRLQAKVLQESDWERPNWG